MADTCTTYTFGSLTVNPSSGDGLVTDFDEGQITGLDGAPVRKQIDPQGQSDGGIVHPAFFGWRVVGFQGKVLIRSVPEGADRLVYAAAVNVVEAAAITALEAHLNSATNLAWTPNGGSAHTLSCTYGTPGGEIQFSGNMIDRRFQFTLVAANPAIS